MIGFVYPNMLWLFLLLLPLVVLWTFFRKLGERKIERFTVRENWNILNQSVSKHARFHKGLLILLALCFSIIAAARPYWGTREREVQTKGVNVIFAIDVSDSMRAVDVQPTRLDYAKTLVQQLLVETRGNRAGLMPFAGDALLQCPLTSDYAVLMNTMKATSFQTIGQKGTNFPTLIEQAIETFESTPGGTRALVVLTDGEDQSDAIDRAAEEAAENNIRIFAIGIGTKDGSTIRLDDGSLKTDQNGSVVLTTLKEDVLRTLADKTMGKAYVAGAVGRFDPTPLVNDLNNLEAADLGSENRIVRIERFQWPLAFALLCLAIEGVIGDRRKQKRRVARRPHHLEGAAKT